MTDQNVFELRVNLVRALSSPQWDALSRVSGSVSLCGELFNFFESLVNSGQAEWLGPGPSPVINQPGNVSLKIQNGLHGGAEYGFAVENFSRLLAFDGAQIRVLEPVYIAEYNWASGEANEPPDFKQYRLAIELIDWLRARADHSDSDRLVFLLSEKLELIPSFEPSDLKVASFEGLGTLKELLASDLHKDQRRAVAVKALIDMLGALPTKERFSFLLRNLPQYVENVRNGYSLYASEFSYEKIRDKVEEARIDIAGKINKTISDIQNQILAIPVATVLVATQMKYGAENILSNIALVVASLFFTALMYLVIRNQRDTLKVLGSEISRQERSLEKEYEKGADQFRQTFAQLRLRQQKQHERLRILWKIVLAGLVLSAFFAGWISTRVVSPMPTPAPTASITPAKQPSDAKPVNGATGTAAVVPSVAKAVGKAQVDATQSSPSRP